MRAGNFRELTIASFCSGLADAQAVGSLFEFCSAIVMPLFIVLSLGYPAPASQGRGRERKRMRTVLAAEDMATRRFKDMLSALGASEQMHRRNQKKRDTMLRRTK